MNTKKMSAVTTMFYSVIVSAGIQLQVSANPALPAKNLLPGDTGFEKEKTFKNPALKIVNGGYRSSKALHVGKINATFVYNGFGLKRGIEIGKSYIVSCMIKPDPGFEKLQTSGMYGLGISLGVWTKNWKNTKNGMTRVHDGGPSEWRRISSKPVRIGEDTGVVQVWIGNECNKVTGLIDDVAVYDAETELSVTAKSDIPIRQVTITDDTGKNIFDSGILKDGSKKFVRTIKVLTPYTYTVRVINGEGDIKTFVYPGKDRSSDELFPDRTAVKRSHPVPCIINGKRA